MIILKKEGQKLIYIQSYNSYIDSDTHTKNISGQGDQTRTGALALKKKMFIQIKNIWYYNVYIHKLKLSIKYFNLNITVTSHAEKVSMFTRQISDTRMSLLW